MFAAAIDLTVYIAGLGATWLMRRTLLSLPRPLTARVRLVGAALMTSSYRAGLPQASERALKRAFRELR